MGEAARRIVIVDDDPLVLRTTAEILEAFAQLEQPVLEGATR